MLNPGLSLNQARKGHTSRLLILVLLQLGTISTQNNNNHWRSALKEFKVIPDLLSQEPTVALGAVYNIFIVNFGELLTPHQIQNQPTRMYWPVEDRWFYSLVVTGPDAPTTQHAVYREWIHWLIVNIPGNQWLSGDQLVEYQGDSKVYGPGPHRCVYIAFKQPRRLKMHFNEERIKTGSNDHLRANFSTESFVKKYNLSEPIASNFFVFESEFSKATIHPNDL